MLYRTLSSLIVLVTLWVQPSVVQANDVINLGGDLGGSLMRFFSNDLSRQSHTVAPPSVLTCGHEDRGPETGTEFDVTKGTAITNVEYSGNGSQNLELVAWPGYYVQLDFSSEFFFPGDGVNHCPPEEALKLTLDWSTSKQESYCGDSLAGKTLVSVGRYANIEFADPAFTGSTFTITTSAKPCPEIEARMLDSSSSTEEPLSTESSESSTDESEGNTDESEGTTEESEGTTDESENTTDESESSTEENDSTSEENESSTEVSDSTTEESGISTEENDSTTEENNSSPEVLDTTEEPTEEPTETPEPPPTPTGDDCEFIRDTDGTTLLFQTKNYPKTHTRPFYCRVDLTSETPAKYRLDITDKSGSTFRFYHRDGYNLYNYQFGTDSSSMEAYIGVGDGDIRVYHSWIANGQSVKFQIKVTKIEDSSTHMIKTLAEGEEYKIKYENYEEKTYKEIWFQAPQGRRVRMTITGLNLNANRCTCFGYDYFVANSYGNADFYWSLIRCNDLRNGGVLVRTSWQNKLYFYFRGELGGEGKSLVGTVDVV